TVFDNVIYGLRHRSRNGALPAGEDGDWLDLEPIGVNDRAGLAGAVLDVCRVVGLDEDLFGFGLRATIDPQAKPAIAARRPVARQLVVERFPAEGGEPAVEFFDHARFAAHASIGENVLFGHSPAPELAFERLAHHPHFLKVVAEVELERPLLELGASAAKDMVEIFKDIRPGDEF